MVEGEENKLENRMPFGDHVVLLIQLSLTEVLKLALAPIIAAIFVVVGI